MNCFKGRFDRYTAKTGIVHSVSGCTRGVQVKLWDPSRTRAIPKRLRGLFTTRRYTKPRLPLPQLTTDTSWNGDADELRMSKRRPSRLQYNSSIHEDRSTGILPTWLKTDDDDDDDWLCETGDWDWRRQGDGTLMSLHHHNRHHRHHHDVILQVAVV